MEIDSNKIEETYSPEPLHITGVVEDLPEARENLKDVFVKLDERERQFLIETGNEKFGLPELPVAEQANIISSFHNSLLNSPLTQMGGGIRDAVVNTVEALGSLVDLGFKSESELRERFEIDGFGLPKDVGAERVAKKITAKVPDIPKSDSIINNIARTAVQYSVDFIPFMRGLKRLSTIPKIGRTLQSGTAGMLTAFASLDPDTPKFGEFIESLHPKLKIPLLDFLKASPADTDAEKRFKNSIDDALAFGAIGGTFFAISKFIRNALILGKKLNATTIKPKKPLPQVKPEVETKKPKLSPNLVKVTNKTGEDLKDFLEINAADVELAKGNLNLNFENWKIEEDIITSLNKVAALFEQEAKQMGRGVRKSSKELLEQVKNSGFSIKEMLALNKNQPLNDVQMKSFIVHLYHIQKKLESLKTAYKAGNLDVAEELLQTFALSKELVPKFLGAGSTAGRALKALDTIKADFDGNLTVVRDLINATEEIPLGVDIQELIIAHDLLPTAKGRSLFARIALTAQDMFAEAWLAALVSGTKTILGVNTAGNLSLLVFGIGVRALASGKSAIFSAGKAGVAPQEAQYLIYGMINSIDEAFRVAGQTLRKGEQSIEFTKFDFPRQIRGDRINLDFIDNKLTQNIIKRGVDLLGEIIRLPFRALSTTDDFFKVLNTRGYLWALGARKAYSLGHVPGSEDWMQVVADVIKNPTKRLRDEAIEFGHIQTLTNTLNKKGHGFIEGAGATIGEFANNHLLMKIIVPFSKIATNVTKYSLETTPLAFLMADTRAAIGRGGADRDMAFAKIALGSMLGILFASLAATGVITGTFPTDSINLKRLKRDSGVDQNSFIIGKKSFPYRRFDPIGLTIGMAADFVEMAETLGFDDLSKMALVISTIIAENVLNKSYLVGIADVLDVLLGRRSPASVMQRFASTLVPFSSLIREGVRFFDPTIVAPNSDLPSLWEKFKNGFMSGKPGQNRYLRPKRSFFGEILQRNRYFDIKNIKDDRVLAALIENEVETSYQADRVISGRRKGRLRQPKASDGIILNDEHYDRMLELFGIVTIGGIDVREAIEQVLDTPLFGKATKSIKAEILESIISLYRTVAENKMIDEDTESGGILERSINLKKILELRE